MIESPRRTDEHRGVADNGGVKAIFGIDAQTAKYERHVVCRQ